MIRLARVVLAAVLAWAGLRLVTVAARVLPGPATPAAPPSTPDAYERTGPLPGFDPAAHTLATLLRARELRSLEVRA